MIEPFERKVGHLEVEPVDPADGGKLVILRGWAEGDQGDTITAAAKLAGECGGKDPDTADGVGRHQHPQSS